MIRHMENIHYTLIFRPEPEGGFTVTVPALPGCVTYGKNLKQAKEMAADAIGGYLASLRKDKEPIPTDQDIFVGSIRVRAPIKRKALSHV